jgi:hypothetical protein
MALLVSLLGVELGYGATFVDVTTAKGLAGDYVNPAAWGDFNSDGWVDLYVTGGPGGAVWTNNLGTGGTGFTFLPSSVPSSTYGVWGDIDNNGYLDIFVGDLFMEAPPEFHLDTNGANFQTDTSFPVLPIHVSWGASWADHDGDGDLDLYVGGFEVWPSPEYPDVILVNNNGTLSVKWQQSSILRGRGVTSCDFDEDDDMDIYVSNYRLQPNTLWRNDGSGNFTDVAAAYGVAGDIGGIYNYGHTIGSCWGDMDNDGHFDLFVGNFRHPWDDGSQDFAKFYRNEGPPDYHFELMDELDGVDWQEAYASPTLGDYDNDGDLDLFYTTVDITGNHPARLYRNNGNWQFENVTGAAGLGSIPNTYQAAWADYDNDGDLDLLTAGRLYENQGNSNHWLKVRLEGDGQFVNRSAIGAQVRINLGGSILTRQVEAGTGQGNQNDLTLHFGLGSHTGSLTLEITWPNGDQDVLTGIAVDQLVQHSFTSDTVIYFSDDFDGNSGALNGQASDTGQIYYDPGWGTNSLDYTPWSGSGGSQGAGASVSWGQTSAIDIDTQSSGLLRVKADLSDIASDGVWNGGAGGANLLLVDTANGTALEVAQSSPSGLSVGNLVTSGPHPYLEEGNGSPLVTVQGGVSIVLDIDLDNQMIDLSWQGFSSTSWAFGTSGAVNDISYTGTFNPNQVILHGSGGRSGLNYGGFDNVLLFGPGCSFLHSEGLGLLGDFNRDCYVNIVDFAVFIQNWFQCNDPTDKTCD